MKIGENAKKLLLSGAGFALTLTILGYAGKYLMAQEAEKVVAPVRVEQQATSKMIADMKFEKRYDESQELFMACLDGHTQAYCDEEDAWRWEVHYPYLDCISGLEYAAREETCGPAPAFTPSEGIEP